jgi:two-component system NtrC family sensor kinase
MKNNRNNHDSDRNLPGVSGQNGDTSVPDMETGEYYRRLRRRLRAGLLIAYLAPLAIILIYFYFQFNVTLKESGKLHVVTLAESQRNTIDLFLQERVVNIFNLFSSKDFKLSPTPDDMRFYLQNLRGMDDAFIDVGFLDEAGVQAGYAGPYPYLQGKDYSRETWFQTLKTQHKNYLITDIYLGFRNKPHFTIAVKQIFSGKPYIMRATLDPDKFYLFLRTITKGKGEDSALINYEGRYQIVDPDRGELLGPSNYVPPKLTGSGAHEISSNGDTVLVAYAWLKEAPWSLIVRQPLGIAYAEMYRIRRIMSISTAILAVLIISAILLTTDRLLKRAQHTAESKKELKSQLFHASKLVAAGELAGGVAHEINNPLAIIAAESGVIRDMLDPSLNMESSPAMIVNELNHIDEAVFRARDITQKLLNFVRKNEPRPIRCNINSIMDDVMGGIKERELEVADIELIRKYDPDMPDILIDPDQIRQVFLNIINNASDAIDKAGAITLETRHNSQFVTVTVTDTGKGITPEQAERIFLPFYTTKEVGKGTGLGLSVSLSIVQGMGGRIDVQSLPGSGSSFTVVLPINIVEERSDVA